MLGMLLVVPIGFVTGFGFAAFGVLLAAIARTIDNFNYITSAVLTPMFLVAGTFFPVSSLPAGIRTVAQVNPLYHCVQLVRDAVLFGLRSPTSGTPPSCSASRSSCGAWRSGGSAAG